MIIKITLTVLVALVVAVAITYFVNDLYNSEFKSTSLNKLFYSQKFEPEQKKIFLVGSSHVVRINATIVENYISQTLQDYEIYNLGINTDHPTKRINHIQGMIKSKPVLVVYGVSFRNGVDVDKEQKPITDVIGVNKPIDGFPEPWIFLDEWIKNNIKINFSNFKNPQKSMIGIFEILTNQNNEKSAKLKSANTPFQKYNPRMNEINDEDYLKNNLKHYWNSFEGGFSGYDLNTGDLKKIISELKKNDIEVILFSAPLSRIYLDEINDKDIKIFEDDLKKISDEFDVKLYHFYDKYADMNVWMDVTHVSTNLNASIYSTDIADIILNEINP